jgi:hypothetical protein
MSHTSSEGSVSPLPLESGSALERGRSRELLRRQTESARTTNQRLATLGDELTQVKAQLTDMRQSQATMETMLVDLVDLVEQGRRPGGQPGQEGFRVMLLSEEAPREEETAGCCSACMNALTDFLC